MRRRIRISEDGEALLSTRTKIILLILAVILFVTVGRGIAANTSTYQGSADYLDKKMANATMLSLGSASASFVVSLLPDDTGTPIANGLAEFSTYLLVVISAIFLERYLLTTIGFVGTVIILPLACIFTMAAILAQPENRMKWKEYAYRLFIFGLCIMLVIPLGCLLGREIENINAQSIEAALADAKTANEIVESMPEEKQDKNVFERIGDFFSGLWNSAKEAYEWAKTVLTNFMASIAVMMVTTIVIPVLMALCFLWLIRFLTKRDFVIAVVGLADRAAGYARQKLRTRTGSRS